MSQPDGLEELRKKEEELRKLVASSSLTLAPLTSDFNHAIENWRQDPNSQFWSRTAIRCLCAAIEATLFTFRQMAQGMAHISGVQFEKEELEILAEKRIVAGPNGIQITKPKFLQFPDPVKESLRLFAKAIGATLKIDYGVVGFTKPCDTFSIRNRLMHPKHPFDVRVDTNDIDIANQGIAWFNQTHHEVIDQCHAHLANNIVTMMKSAKSKS